MANIDFPTSPTVGQVYTFGGVNYIFNAQGVWSTNGTAFAPINSPIFTGDPHVPTPSPGDNDFTVANTAFVASAVAAGGGGGGGFPQSGRLLFVNIAQLSFKPYNGDRIKINGTTYPIPSAGIAGLGNTGVFVNGVAGQSLVANTLYYVYVFVNGATLTADFSATARATSIAVGNVGTEIKAGDETRSLIGLVYADASGQFQDSLTNRFVISWFNRRNRSIRGLSTGTATLTVNAPAEINAPNSRVYFVMWSDEDFLVGSGGSIQPVSASMVQTAIKLDDVASVGFQVTSMADTANNACAVTAFGVSNPALTPEGLHFLAPVGNTYPTAVNAVFTVQLNGSIRG